MKAKKILAALILSAVVASSAQFMAYAEVGGTITRGAETQGTIDTSNIKPDETPVAGNPDIVGITAELPSITLKGVYENAVMLILSNTSVKAEGVTVSKGADGSFEVGTSDPDAFIKFAESCGLITGEDKLNFYKENKKAFSYDKAATREDFAVAIERMFAVLKKYGVEFTNKEYEVTDKNSYGLNVGETIKSIIVANDNNKATVKDTKEITNYVDSKDLKASAKTAFEYAIEIGAINPKKFEEVKVWAFNSHKDQPALYTNPTKLSKDQKVNGVFLAPNDTITATDIQTAFAALGKLRLTSSSVKTEAKTTQSTEATKVETAPAVEETAEVSANPPSVDAKDYYNND